MPIGTQTEKEHVELREAGCVDADTGGAKALFEGRR